MYAWINSLSDAESGAMVAFGFVVLVPYPVSVLLCEVVVEALLAVGIGVDVLADVNVNVSAAVMTALEFPVSIPYGKLSC